MQTRKQMFLEEMRRGVSRSSGQVEVHFQNIIDTVLPMSLKQFEIHETEMRKVIRRCGTDIPRLTRELRELHRRH